MSATPTYLTTYPSGRHHSAATYAAARNVPIVHGDRLHLRDWIESFIGPRLADVAVCRGHHSPLDIMAFIYFEKPSSIVVLGPRGGGKSMCSAIAAHMECRFAPRGHYATRIMGGSEQQARQIYDAINELIYMGRGLHGSDRDTIDDLLSRKATYRNGSNIAILTASSKSSRGPHVPKLCLDEIDEIRRDIFNSAVGMAQEDVRRGNPTQIVMTSTWHRENGLMGEKIEAARGGAFPIREFCVFEVLELCPDSRSGPDLEKCPECPIVSHCHADMDGHGRGVPKAKRSNGHYTIKSFIQKAELLGMGMIESDYLCTGPRHEGIWFKRYSDANEATDVMVAAGVSEFDPRHSVVLGIDYGVHTGAVAYQIRRRVLGGRPIDEIHIFGEYYSNDLPAEENARRIGSSIEPLTGGKNINSCEIYMDPSAGTKDPIGPTGLAEYRRAGITSIRWWPHMAHRKMESLRLLDSFIMSGSGTRHLFVHPRCTVTRKAFRNYSRKRVGDVWLDQPEDPCHPFEEMIDALAGSLLAKYPRGRLDGLPTPRRVPIAAIY
jgi:hypothetical protein